MNCSTIRDVLPEYARGELEPGVAAAVQEHVADCEECRTELKLVRELVEPVPTPAGLEDRLVLAVRSRPATGWGGTRYYAVAAAFVVTVVAASLLLKKIQATHPDPRADEQVAFPSMAWPDGGDPLLHGTPGLQALSEGELMKLLQELES